MRGADAKSGNDTIIARLRVYAMNKYIEERSAAYTVATVVCRVPASSLMLRRYMPMRRRRSPLEIFTAVPDAA